VVRTRVGYCGGTKENPSYYNLGDHTETLEVDFDPDIISYQALLEVFWKYHSPWDRPISKQYASLIFYNSDEQKKLALESKANIEKNLEKPVYTEVYPNSGFHLAEAYHQKYYLQQVRIIMEDFKAKHIQTKDFIDSSLAARVNGYIRGYGSIKSLREEIQSLGLSPRASSRLMEIVEGYGR